MLCHYCGSQQNAEDITFQRKSGISTDDPDTTCEEQFIVGSAACHKCGTLTKSVVEYTNLSEAPEYDYQPARFELVDGEPVL